jgi:hypothetical protein
MLWVAARITEAPLHYARLQDGSPEQPHVIDVPP